MDNPENTALDGLFKALSVVVEVVTSVPVLLEPYWIMALEPSEEFGTPEIWTNPHAHPVWLAGKPMVAPP
jgi:hypothetical protein